MSVSSILPSQALEAEAKGAREQPVSTIPGVPAPPQPPGPGRGPREPTQRCWASMRLCGPSPARGHPWALPFDAFTGTCCSLHPACVSVCPLTIQGRLRPSSWPLELLPALLPALPCLSVPQDTSLALGASQGLDLPADTPAPHGTQCQNLTSVGKSSN